MSALYLTSNLTSVYVMYGFLTKSDASVCNMTNLVRRNFCKNESTLVVEFRHDQFTLLYIVVI